MNAIEKMKNNGIHLDYVEIASLCKKYNVKELSVFGSSIRDDFHENSDVDFLISYVDIWENSLFDMLRLKNELAQLLKRKVDLVEKEGLENPIRKRLILASAEVIYANR